MRRRFRTAPIRLLEDVGLLLLVVIAFPLVILVVGTPIALILRLLIEIGRRW